MKRPRVVVADDHTILVEGLRGLLEPEFELVGTAEDGRALLAATEALRPEIVVLDISMPLLNGIEVARQIRKTQPAIKIVFLTMHPDIAFVTEAFRIGASGYVLKRAAASELVTALHQALQGHCYLSPLVTKDTLETLLQRSSSKRESSPLTTRQREVLQLLAEGHAVKEIATVLNVAARTVEFHKYRIMEELGLRTVAELTQYALKHGILPV